MDLRAVCLVRAIVVDDGRCVLWGVVISGCAVQEEKFGEGEGGGDALIPVASGRQGGRLIWKVTREVGGPYDRVLREGRKKAAQKK